MLSLIDPNDFNLFIDLKYATKENFVKEKLYSNTDLLLHEDATAKLIKASKIANNKGLRLKIFDAYRPFEIQEYMWNKFPNNKFISNPYEGSVPHCRGIAVDLTLTDQNGTELEMGTEFDHFSEKSFHGNNEISKEAQQNRLLLLGIMTQAGWDFYTNEWWHYQLFNPRDYDIVRDVAP